MPATDLKSYVEGYDVRVLADSVSEMEYRLSTIVVTFPRFVLAELNTHRAFSRNSASSRAIPPEKIIASVEENPFIPFSFNARVKGMGVGEELSTSDREKAKSAWLRGRDRAVVTAKELLEVGLDKSRVNRVLEPYLWHTAIISATEWENFHGLRTPDKWGFDVDFPAQLEFQVFASMIRESLQLSTPTEVHEGEWHLPLLDEDDYHDLSMSSQMRDWPLASAGRCAKVSYITHEKKETVNESIIRALNLQQSGHWSPMEHPATPMSAAAYISGVFQTPRVGNFDGWIQLRKTFPDESNSLLTRIPDALQRQEWLYGSAPTS